VLGYKPEMTTPDGGTFYRSGATWFEVYPSQFAGTNQATAAAWQVTGFDSLIADLKAAGLRFEDSSGAAFGHLHVLAAALLPKSDRLLGERLEGLGGVGVHDGDVFGVRISQPFSKGFPYLW
jgi:hypothetical protein